MRTFRLAVLSALMAFLATPLFCYDKISDYTTEKITEILQPYVIMGLEDETEGPLQKISTLEKEMIPTLQKIAVDYEQEILILESLYLMERRHYQFDPETKSPELNELFKEQFRKNERWLTAHDKQPVNKWLLLFTGDLTSCYMVRSIAATISYGMHVRRLYERALEEDPDFALAYINLGLWRQYAPMIFGGGEERAFEEYSKAFDCAKTNSEKYISSIYISQYWFEKGNEKKCADYLKIAEDTFPQSKEIPLIRKMNGQGISLFVYNRNQSGVDDDN